MTKKRLDELERMAERRSREFSRLEDVAYGLAAETGSARPVEARVRTLRKAFEGYPEGYDKTLVGMIVARNAYGSETALRTTLSRSGYRSPDPEAFEAVCGRPWRFGLFEVRERLAEGFFRIVEPETGEESLLVSAAVERESEAGPSLVISGLFGDESLVQTFGPVLGHPAFGIGEFRSFARLAAPQAFEVSGLYGVLQRDPAPFFLLSRFAKFRISGPSGRGIVWASSRFRADVALAGDLARFGNGKNDRSSTRYRVGKGEGPAEAELLLEKGGKAAVLLAPSAEEYRELASREPFAGRAPAEPEYLASPGLLAAAGALLGKGIPGLEAALGGLAPHAEAEAGKGNPDSDLVAMNRALAEYSHLRDDGAGGIDAADIARRFGAEPGTFAEIVESVERSVEEKSRIQVPGAIDGAKPLAPRALMTLRERLDECPLFSIADDAGLAADFLSRKDAWHEAVPEGTRGRVTLKRLPALLDVDARGTFGGGGRLTLNLTMLLLARHGATPRPIVDYGSSLLREAWAGTAQSREEKDIRRFLEVYEDWIRFSLEPFGLVALEPFSARAAGRSGLEGFHGSARAMRRTPFFERWLRETALR